jgi:TRAP-type C4-dicarboxylate transport system permease small subunit
MEKWLSFLFKLSTKANRIAAYISAFLILFLVLINSYNVVIRYIFNKPLPGVLDLSSTILPVVVFLGLGYVLGERKHIRMEIIHERLGATRTRAIVDIITTSFIAIFAAVFIWKGTELLIAKIHDYSSGDLHFPLFPFYIFVPIGSLLLLVQSLIHIKTYLSSLGKYSNNGIE